MVTELIGKYGRIELPIADYTLSKQMLTLFDNFSNIIFDDKVECDESITEFVNIIYESFSLATPIVRTKKVPHISSEEDKDKNVLVAYSSGLDSAYHALMLRELGYKVHLFYMQNINKYEGRMALQCALEFAEKTNLDLVVGNCRLSSKHRQYWVENPIKNQFIESVMADICIHKGWNYIGIGDDASLSLKSADHLLGTNTTDCREIQDCFCKCLRYIYPNITVLPINRGIGSIECNKYERLRYLKDNGLLNYYYSCVGAGRFNKYNHDRNENKYRISLPRYNCGCSCPKCSLHNLLMHYIGGKPFPDDFINKCWACLYGAKHSTTKNIFGNNIPLNKRIENLLLY